MFALSKQKDINNKIKNTKKLYKMKNSNTQSQSLSNKPVTNSNNEVKNAASKNQFEKNAFSSADLWNIQKSGRTAFARRRSLMS